MLGPVLFNINLIDFFLEFEDDSIKNYVDDTTRYFCAEDMSSVVTELQKIAKKNLRWCNNNNIQANSAKIHVLLSSNIQIIVPFDYVQITSSLSEKLLGTPFDLELKFEEHISKIYNMVN